jgi:microcystin degradation protein MlrC
MEVSNIADEAQAFERILTKTGANQQNINAAAVKRQDNVFRGRRRHRVEALAAQQGIHQELATHGERVGDQDSSPEIRIGYGFQAKSTAANGG